MLNLILHVSKDTICCLQKQEEKTLGFLFDR